MSEYGIRSRSVELTTPSKLRVLPPLPVYVFMDKFAMGRYMPVYHTGTFPEFHTGIFL
jgi:hypothetical protein